MVEIKSIEKVGRKDENHFFRSCTDERRYLTYALLPKSSKRKTVSFRHFALLKRAESDSFFSEPSTVLEFLPKSLLADVK